MAERDLRMVIIADVNNAESREVIAKLSANPQIPQSVITPQAVRNILPGIRATPAVGVLLWSSDLQGLVTDVDAFAAYIKNENETLSALEMLGVETKEAETETAES